jgi:hypothetical protein
VYCVSVSVHTIVLFNDVFSLWHNIGGTRAHSFIIALVGLAEPAMELRVVAAFCTSNGAGLGRRFSTVREVGTTLHHFVTCSGKNMCQMVEIVGEFILEESLRFYL